MSHLQFFGKVTFQLTKLHILQLPEGGTPSEENTDMRYSLVASILQPLESSHMVLLTTHFAICQVRSQNTIK